jgi:hypothetical protein
MGLIAFMPISQSSADLVLSADGFRFYLVFTMPVTARLS